MNALLQNVAVGAIVLGAAGFLVWRRVRRRARPTPMCGDCPNCAAESPAPPRSTLVNIGESPRRR